MGSGFLDILEVLDNLGVPESGGSGCSGGSGVSGGACAIHGSTQTLCEVWCTSRPSERWCDRSGQKTRGKSAGAASGVFEVGGLVVLPSAPPTV